MLLGEVRGPLPEDAELIRRRTAEDGRGEQGNQADHRAHLESHAVAARELQHVVVEPVLLVPQLVVVEADAIHRPRDVDEMVVELARELLVDGVLERQLQGDGEHVQAEHRHPARPVRLLECPARGERSAAVEDPDVVEPEEPALEHVVAEGVLPVHPPREVHEELVKDALQEEAIALAPDGFLDEIDLPGGLAVHGWVDVAEVPLVGGDLSSRVEIDLVGHEPELVLGEVEVDGGQDHAVEGQIPGREPRILPCVGH